MIRSDDPEIAGRIVRQASAEVLAHFLSGRPMPKRRPPAPPTFDAVAAMDGVAQARALERGAWCAAELARRARRYRDMREWVRVAREEGLNRDGEVFFVAICNADRDEWPRPDPARLRAALDAQAALYLEGLGPGDAERLVREEMERFARERRKMLRRPCPPTTTTPTNKP